MLVKATPRIQYMHPLQSAAYVQVIVRVRDPGRVLGCHATVWDWGDGSLSAEEPDCEPEEVQADLPTLYVPLPRWHPYRAAGEYVVRVDVCKNLTEDGRKCKDTRALGEFVVFVKDGNESETDVQP